MTAFSGRTDAPEVRCDLTDRQTQLQYPRCACAPRVNYYNPRCACAPRVNNSTLLSCALQAAHPTPPTGYGPRTMAESKMTVSLVPLNGSNYPTWKVQCRMALVRDGLWRIVEGTETAPPAEGTADRRSKFIARRDRPLATIVLAVEPSLLYLIGDPEDPVVVWQKL